MDIHQLLKQYWGYNSFREPQEAIVNAVLNRHDVLAVLPTGGGKSICFQLPTLKQEGICIVVTPLIALMQDQVKQLKSLNIAALAVHAGLSHREIDIQLDNCVYGKIKFLYVSPERLQSELFVERYKKMKVCLIAVDEAHCISQWGHDFRPPYLQISTLRNYTPGVPVIALTASATKQVQDEIVQKLEMKNPLVFQNSFARDNIALVVRATEAKEKKLLEILNRVAGSAIVYVRSRKMTSTLFSWLEKNGISATFYHAGLTHDQRAEAQEHWIQNRKRVMVATNAFGMGINKPDVRCVVHMDLPEDIESYYQEAGRAGRDGKRSFAALVYHEVDLQTLRHKTHQSQPTLDVLQRVYQAIANFYQLALGSAQGESFGFDIDAFCDRFDFKSAEIHPALKKLEETGLIQFNESFYRPSRAHISIDRKKIYEFQVAHAHFDPIIKMMLRIYGAELFSDFVTISVGQLATSLKKSQSEITILLDQLHKLQVMVFEPAADQPQITFVLPRQDAARLPIDRARLEMRRQLHLDKMEAMIRFTQQAVQCRMQFIQEYFGENTEVACGKCDVCVDKRKRNSLTAMDDYQEQILYILKQKGMTVDELETAVAPKDSELFIEAVRELVDKEILAYNDLWVLNIK